MCRYMYFHFWWTIPLIKVMYSFFYYYISSQDCIENIYASNLSIKQMDFFQG